MRAGPRDAAPTRLGDTWGPGGAGPPGGARRHLPGASATASSPVWWRRWSPATRTRIDRADWDIFRATGVAHLMSISGLHVTMFAWAAARWWRCGGAAAPVPGVAGAARRAAGWAAAGGGLRLFSGWGGRRSARCGCWPRCGLLRLAGRRWPWPSVWLLACAVVVSIDPWALRRPASGSALSRWGLLFARFRAPQRPCGLEPGLALMLREQWVVTLALTPLSLLLFGRVWSGWWQSAGHPWVTLLWSRRWRWAACCWPRCAKDAARWRCRAGRGAATMAALPLATCPWRHRRCWAGAGRGAGRLVLAMRWPGRCACWACPAVARCCCGRRRGRAW